MLRDSLYFFLFFVSYFSAMQNNCVACEARKKVDLKSLDKNQILGDIAFRYLNQKLDIEELKRFEQKDIPPSTSTPFTILDASLQARICAEALIAQNLTLAEVEPLLYRVRKSLIKPADPFLFFALAEALYRRLSAPEECLKKAFTLMARMIMDAPFLHYAENSTKRGFVSFRYFAHCANFYQDMVLVPDEDDMKVVDSWQIFFFYEAFPSHHMPWLTELYYFYWRESFYMMNTPDPFTVDEWPKLRKKITSPDRYYDLEWLADQVINKSTWTSSFEYYDHLQEYFIKDVNIYWHLLPKLVDKDVHLQADFLKAMSEAHADPATIIDKEGTTALKMAGALNLGFVQERNLKPLRVSQETKPKKEEKPTDKRKAEKDLHKPAKRPCKENQRPDLEHMQS